MTAVAQKAEIKANPAAVAPAGTSQQAYWPQLDGLRTVAFMMVFMHHLGGITGHDFPNMSKAQLIDINNYVAWGWTGVDVFFVLSGFLISYLLIAEKEKFGNVSFKFFFARRALRIWPIYYALLFFAAFAVPAMCWGAVQAHYGQYLGQVLPLALFAGNYSLMFPDFLLKFSDSMNVPVIFLLLPLWSLAVEEQFYMTWPFIVNFIKKPATIYKVIGGLMLSSVAIRAGLWYLAAHVWHSDYPYIFYYQATPAHLEPLMVGALAATTIYYHPQVFARLTKFTPLLMVAMFFLSRHIGKRVPDIVCNMASNIYMFDLVALMCGLFLVTALTSPTFKAIFGHPLMAKFGRLTYAMYLLHYFAIGLTDNILITSPALAFNFPTWCVRFVMALGLTYGLSVVSWHLVEKRFLALRKHYTRA